jgi:hypothetical protein
MKILAQPWMVAMEATIFTGWIYDHLLPYAAHLKVAHPMLLAEAGASRFRTSLPLTKAWANIPATMVSR